MSSKKTFRFNKIIRDHLLKKMQNDPEVSLKIQEPNPSTKITYLKEKLEEEVNEVLETNDPSEIKKELADVLEVIHALAKTIDSSFKEIEKLRNEKKERAGEFEQCSYIESVTVPNDHRISSYCSLQPHKYPEIQKEKKPTKNQ